MMAQLMALQYSPLSLKQTPSGPASTVRLKYREVSIL